MRNIWTIAKREFKIYFSSLWLTFDVDHIWRDRVIFALNIINLTSNPFRLQSSTRCDYRYRTMAFYWFFSAQP